MALAVLVDHADRAMNGSSIDDIDLAAAIAAALQSARIPPAVMICVSHAVVTLEGQVDNLKQRKAVESLVRRFDGVAGIVNGITVGRRR